MPATERRGTPQFRAIFRNSDENLPAKICLAFFCCLELSTFVQYTTIRKVLSSRALEPTVSSIRLRSQKMSFARLLVVVSTLMPILTTALKSVYIIRHCDEIDDTSPCCSLLGYERANTWNRVFDSILESSPMTIYTPGAELAGIPLCKPNIKITDFGSSCQKSQRMAITAQLIKYNLQSNVNMEMNYCSGEYQQVVTDINAAASTVDNALVVWKHTEVSNMINLWNVPLTKWPSDLDVFDVVFRLNFTSNSDKHPTLAYNCYDYENNQMACSTGVQAWLKDYPTFDVALPVALKK